MRRRSSSAITSPPCSTPSSCRCRPTRRSPAVVPIADEVRGEPIVGALFDAAALDVVTALAVGSVTGTATIRVATDRYQQSQAAAGVGRIADGEIADPDRFLREALADAARLEAHIVGHVGHRAEAMGRSRDDVITFWTDAASEAIDIVDVPGLDIVRRPGGRGDGRGVRRPRGGRGA